MRTTTAESLTTHLYQIGMLDGELDALCTRERIMLDCAHVIPPNMESLTIMAKSKLISKTVEFEDRSVVVSAAPEVDLTFILKYIRVVSSDFSSHPSHPSLPSHPTPTPLPSPSPLSPLTPPYLFSLPPDSPLELTEKSTSFALALELPFDSAEGDIVVQLL